MKLVNIITDIIREGSVKSEERVKLYEDDTGVSIRYDADRHNDPNV